jgi:hypothetical protein
MGGEEGFETQKNHPTFVVNWFHPVFTPSFFFLSASTPATYIFIALTCTATTISLEPCALNAEFHHFIPRFNKISSLYLYHSFEVV